MGRMAPRPIAIESACVGKRIRAESGCVDWPQTTCIGIVETISPAIAAEAH
jgi:hypothetical protein